MNICILTKSTLSHLVGGMEVHAQTLAETAVGLGHQVSVITTSHPQGIEHEAKNGVDYFFLVNTKVSRYSRAWWKASVDKLFQLNEEEKIDVIWAESFSGWCYAIKFKHKMCIPIISIMHGKGIIGVIQSGWNALVSLQDFIYFFIKYLPEAIFSTAVLFWQTLHYSDAIIAVSDETLSSIRKEFFVSTDKIFVVYNAIDTEIFKPDSNKRDFIRKRYSLSSCDKILLMSGVVHKQKGMQIGIQAFIDIKKKFPTSKMIIVGDGLHLEYLKSLVKKLNLEREVFFAGFVPNQETSLYYNAADIFLNPTLRVEGFPLVIAEAMACGLPVITSKIGGIQSAIEEGISGFFIKPKDINYLIEKALFILNNSELAKSMGESARQRALKKFNKRLMAEQYLNISKELITKKEKCVCKNTL